MSAADGIGPRVDADDAPRVRLPVVQPTARAPHSRRGKTLSMRRLSKRAMEREAREFPDTGERAPADRTQCPTERPCGYVSCSAHLALDINEDNGNIKVNFPGEDGEPDLDAMPETCLFDVIERGGATMEDVGAVIGITRERVRQLEDIALAKVRDEAPDLADYLVADRQPVTVSLSRTVGIRRTPDAHRKVRL